MNYVTIIIGAFINMVVGAVWYSPVLFAKPWMKAIGIDKKEMDQAMREGVGPRYAMMAVNSLILSCVMAWIIRTIGASTFFGGVQVGFLAWIGFSTTTRFANWVFSGRPKELFFIDTGYHLVTYSLIGGLLAVWR